MIAQAVSGADPAAKFAYIRAQIAASAARPGPLRELLQFAYVERALQLQADIGGMSRQETRELRALGEALLVRNGIKATTSRLGFLYADLANAESNRLSREGQPWDAAWQLILGAQQSRRALTEPTGPRCDAMGRRVLRLGHADLAIVWFYRALGQGDAVGSELITALRLARRFEEAKSLALAGQMYWETVLLETAATGSVGPLVQYFRRKGTGARRDVQGLEAYLYVRSAATQEALPADLSPRTRPPEDASLRPLHRAVRRLESCYDTRVAFPQRMKTLGTLLSDAASFERIDHLLLLRAAAARWLARAHAFDAARLVLAEYEALSLALSSGRSADTLGVVADMAARPWYRGEDAS